MEKINRRMANVFRLKDALDEAIEDLEAEIDDLRQVVTGQQELPLVEETDAAGQAA